jgi:hypothetical protein
VLREDAPCLPRILHGRRPDPEALKRNALTIKHAKDVVVRNDKQLCRIREGLIFGKPASIRVAVRAEDRRATYAGIEALGDRSCGGISGKEAVFMEDRH